jgi:hypothetical protein
MKDFILLLTRNEESKFDINSNLPALMARYSMFPEIRYSDYHSRTPSERSSYLGRVASEFSLLIALPAGDEASWDFIESAKSVMQVIVVGNGADVGKASDIGLASVSISYLLQDGRAKRNSVEGLCVFSEDEMLELALRTSESLTRARQMKRETERRARELKIRTEQEQSTNAVYKQQLEPILRIATDMGVTLRVGTFPSNGAQPRE